MQREATMDSVGQREEADEEDEETGQRWEVQVRSLQSASSLSFDADLPRTALQSQHPLHQAQTFSRAASPSLSHSRHHSPALADSSHPSHRHDDPSLPPTRSRSPSQPLPAAPHPLDPLASIPSLHPHEQHPFLKHAAALCGQREAEEGGAGEEMEWKVAGEEFVERFKEAVEKVGGLLECVPLLLSHLPAPLLLRFSIVAPPLTTLPSSRRQQSTRHSHSLSSLSSHTHEIEQRMEKLEETKKRLEGWGGMVLRGGEGSGGRGGER